MSDIRIRRARREDVAAIVALLADDPLGAEREDARDPIPRAYLEAFGSIDEDPNQHLLVAEAGGALAGCLQLTLIPYLTYRGGWRALIEGVRVARGSRGSGMGRRMVEHAIALAREAGCHMVQLTTDKRRPDALGFYRGLGFEATHEGLKLHLTMPEDDA